MNSLGKCGWKTSAKKRDYALWGRAINMCLGSGREIYSQAGVVVAGQAQDSHKGFPFTCSNKLGIPTAICCQTEDSDPLFSFGCSPCSTEFSWDYSHSVIH